MNEGTFIVLVLLLGAILLLGTIAMMIRKKQVFGALGLLLVIQIIVLPFSDWFATVLYFTIILTILAIIVRLFKRNK